MTDKMPLCSWRSSFVRTIFPGELCLKRVLKAPAPIMKTARARKSTLFFTKERSAFFFF
ncbi:hypothetical protein B4140_0433 [Bacillus amyloliquefaciens]|nr:hypothetical protein B4140_0433 [Bacillus amyloliquefaciens]